MFKTIQTFFRRPTPAHPPVTPNVFPDDIHPAQPNEARRQTVPAIKAPAAKPADGPEIHKERTLVTRRRRRTRLANRH